MLFAQNMSVPAHSQSAIARGKEIAARICADCHATDGQQSGVKQRTHAPSFRALASRPGWTPESLQVLIMTQRHPMPAIPLELNEIRDVATYIRSLE
jgi:mono/diheme cytochrome c family protein